MYGFLRMLTKLVSDHGGESYAIFMDASRGGFRRHIYAAYKAQRPPTPPELISQMSLLREASRCCGFPLLESKEFEADDLIASYTDQARRAEREVVIVSSDKDFLQLVGEGVTILDPVRNRMCGAETAQEKFGVPPRQVIDVQALAGDSSDNVPGVPGIGVKTAARLISSFGDLESLLSRAAEVPQPKRRRSLIEYAAQARLSKRLVTLSRNAPTLLALEQLVWRSPNRRVLEDFLAKNEFRSLLLIFRSLFFAREEQEEQSDAFLEEPLRTPSTLAELRQHIAHFSHSETISLECDSPQGHDTGDKQVSAASVHRFTIGDGVHSLRIPVRAGHDATADEHLRADTSRTPCVSEDEEGLPLPDVVSILRPFLEDPALRKVGFDVKRMVRILQPYGIALRSFDDISVLSYVLDAGLHAAHDEKEALMNRHLQESASADLNWILAVYASLRRRLVAARLVSVYETLERPLIPVLAHIESEGVKVDAKALEQLSHDFGRRIAELEGRIHQAAGHSFVVGSPKQLGEILFEEMGLPWGRKGKSGAYATKADLLEKLSAQGHELPRLVLQWRHFSKLRSTYTEALLACRSRTTSRVHTSFVQVKAVTGRLSSVDPNLQNIPIRSAQGQEIRKAFIAQDGWCFLSADYAQIELRLAAEIAGVPGLKKAFALSQDVHAATAAEIFGLSDVDATSRRRAKAINFGILYGMSAFGLGRNLDIPTDIAQRFIADYFARYPEISDYMERAKTLAHKQGFVTTLFGRRIHIPAIRDRHVQRRKFAERSAMNAPIQGTAADIIKRAMIRVGPRLAEAGLHARFLLQVHDELLFEVPGEEVEETARIVKEVMENASLPARRLSVRLVVNCGIGVDWAQAHR